MTESVDERPIIEPVPRLLRVALYIVAVGLMLIFGLVTVGIFTGEPGHRDILDHQVVVENQLEYVSCLLLIPYEDRSPEHISQCQIGDPE